MKIISTKKFRLIRVSYSIKYLEKYFPNLSSELYSYILDRFNKIRGENENHTKSLKTKFINNLRRVQNITEETVKKEFKKIPKFENKEEFKVSPEFEKIIPNITEDKEERIWLRKLVQIGRFQLEDAIKLKNMLEKFNKFKGDKSINEFKTDIELSKFLSQYQEESTKSSEDFVKIDGVKLVKDTGSIQVYYITSQAGLDIIGEGTSWCVLSSNGRANYSPFEYYMFVVNGEARALYHEGSGQFKNEHDGSISESPNLIVKIKDIVRELNLSEFEGFSKVVEEVDRTHKELSVNNNDELVIKLITSGKINYITEDLWGKYGLVMLTSLSSYDGIDFNLMNFLANYAKVHNLNDRFSVMEDHFCNRLLHQPLSTGKMRKLVPKILRTKRVLESNIQGWINYLGENPDQYKNIPDEFKTDPRMKEAEFKGWVEDLGENPYNYKNIPDELKTDPRMKEIALKEWIHYLGWYPHFYKDVPNELKTDPRIKEAAFKGWVEDLERDPRNYKFVPDEFKTDSRMFDVTLSALKKHPDNYKFVPDNYKADEKIKENTIQGWINCLERNPNNYEDIPNELKTNERIQEATIKGWVHYLKKRPDNYKHVPDELKIDSRMFGITLNILEKEQIDNYQFVPSELKSDLRIKEKAIQGWINPLEEHPNNYRHVPDELKTAPRMFDVTLNILEKNPYQYQFVPSELKTDPRIKEAAIKGWTNSLEINPSEYKDVPSELKTDSRMFDVIIQGWINSLERNPNNYEDIPNELKTVPRMFDVTLNILEKSPHQYQFVPNELKTDERIKETTINGWINILERNPDNYKFVPDEFRRFIEEKKNQELNKVESNNLRVREKCVS